MAEQQPSFTIRPATPADEEAALVLMKELFAPPGRRAPGYTPARGRAGFRRAVQDAHSDVLLALDGERVVGLASVYRDILSIRYGQRCWLQDLVVAPACRSRGVGRLLLDAATDWARQRGCTHLQLSSGMGRVDAHRFYRREGMGEEYLFERWLD
ncbi:MAG: GNAT family N-acetyltransferase [Dehalococcoidia bacterium]|nr:GNAT family N-acetyltransferase [Dehalococcoidia bacterium]